MRNGVIDFRQESAPLMIKDSLFAAEEREAKLDRLGDVPQVMELKALAAEVGRDRDGSAVGVRCFPRN